MEQKKTLWIIAAVGVFLLVVLGAALIVSNSSSQNNFEAITTTISPAEETKDFSSGWSSPSEIPPALVEDEIITDSPEYVKDMFVVSENTTIVDLNQNGEGTTIDLNTLKTQVLVEENTNQSEKTNNQSQVIVTKNEPVKNEATDYYVGSSTSAVQAERTEKASSVKRPETTSAVVTTKPASTSTKTTTNKTSTTTAKTTTSSKTTVAPQPKAVTRYWVQVASYTNKKTAENARTILSDKKISSDIYTYQDGNGKLFYRVRVGPFTTKSEAEYWMSKITQIKEFSSAGSYVTSTTDK